MSRSTQQTGRYRLRYCADCGEVFTYDTRSHRRSTLCPECSKGVAPGEPNYKSLQQLQRERRMKAARRKAFFAARDAAFAKAGLPVPRIVAKDGGRIEYRGRCIGGYGPSCVPHC